MTVTTPTFSDEINDVFGNFIKDGRIICSEREFKRGFRELKKQLNLTGKRSSGSEKPRKRSTFMTWLNPEKREALKEEFFSDFDSYSDWSEDGIRQYYKNKELPLDKLEALIEKKHNDGKEIKKPRLMALITIKAGIIWSEMSEEEKNGFSGDEDTMVSLSATKKKGRPSGYKATDYVVDSAVESALNKSQQIDESDEDEVELEEFEYEGATYFKDEEDNVYDNELAKIGILKDGIISK